MENITFENKGTNTFLVYAFKETDEIDSLSFGMITNNKIEGFADSLFTQVNSQKYIKYNITSLVTLKQFFDGTVSKNQFLGVIKNICSSYLSAEEYMIESKTILLDPSMIYVNVSTCEVRMICLPIMNMCDNENDLKPFFKNLTFTTQYNQNEDCSYVASIITYLNNKQAFSLLDLKNLAINLLGEMPMESEKNVEKPAPVVKNVAAVSSAIVEAVPQKAPPSFNKAAPSAPSPQFNSPKKQAVPQYAPAQNKTAPSSPQFNVPQNGKIVPNPQGTMQATGYGAAPKKSNDNISFMHLLMHYNKQNSELYKQQKAAKKAAKSSVYNAPQANYSAQGAQQKPNNFAKTNNNVSFAVPGAPVAPINNAPIKQPQKVLNNAPINTINNAAVPTAANAAYNAPKTQFTVGNADFGETTVLGNASTGETTVLGANVLGAPVFSPYLIRRKNNEKIPINKPLFKIGKERSYVDYFISDNTAVSRSHANIIIRDDKFYIVDTNSTNHTYVNGKMVRSNEETEITQGTNIRLANEDFDFFVC